MKTILFVLLALSITFLSSAQSTTKAKASSLSLLDVEKILGQQAALTESSSELKKNALKYRCTYTANSTDTKTNKLGHLYYLFEKYDNELLAKNVYKDILTQNQHMPNLQKINDIGDEALRHTDFENFDMIIIRKANKLIRLKVNKITSMTSASELQIIAKKLAEAL